MGCDVSSIAEMGPLTITIRDKKVPEWFVCTDGSRYVYESMAVLDRNDQFALAQLKPGQVIIAPGVIYTKSAAPQGMQMIRMQAKGLQYSGAVDVATSVNNLADAYEFLAAEYGRVMLQAGFSESAGAAQQAAMGWIEKRPAIDEGGAG